MSNNFLKLYDENETDDTLFMHQSEQTIQSSDKQDATTKVEKVCKDWQAFIRTHCNDKCLYDLYKNETESLPELSGNDAHYKAIDDLLIIFSMSGIKLVFPLYLNF